MLALSSKVKVGLCDIGFFSFSQVKAVNILYTLCFNFQ